MTTRKQNDHRHENRDVVDLPRISRPPRPPRFGADPRQAQTERIKRVLAGEGQRGERVSGFHAASVSIARLKNALEYGIKNFTKPQLRRRWRRDVRSWMLELLFNWVQRIKFVRLSLHKQGIHVRIETQDDYGYYRYEFDVFSGR